jgi:hypothetical protein
LARRSSISLLHRNEGDRRNQNQGSKPLLEKKGFGKFNVAGYWRRKYRGKGEDEGWYLLTNLGDSQQAIASYKCRSDIVCEAWCEAA